MDLVHEIKEDKMKYKIQEHQERIKEFIIYECAPNGEICRRIAACQDEEEAKKLLSLLDTKSKTFVYGHNNTIHRTKQLNIEVDERTGEIVSVWFRCMALPFDVNRVEKQRVNEMKSMYQENNIPRINAIEVEQEEE